MERERRETNEANISRKNGVAKREAEEEARENNRKKRRKRN